MIIYDLSVLLPLMLDALIETLDVGLDIASKDGIACNEMCGTGLHHLGYSPGIDPAVNTDGCLQAFRLNQCP